MNDKHQGPHCAGSCEGAAYQIEIRNLRHDIERHVQVIGDLEAENEALREAVKRELQYAFVGDYGHMNPCHGWDDRLEEALAAHDQGGDQ